MFSVFNDNDVLRRTINNENSVIARKPTLSARKPLTDRKINVEQRATPSAKPKKTPQLVAKEKSLVDDTPFDYCTYKDVPDNYEDLCIPNNMLDEDTINKIVSAYTRENIQSPEPVGPVVVEPKLGEQFKVNGDEMLDADAIAKLLEKEMNILEETNFEVSLPDDSF